MEMWKKNIRLVLATFNFKGLIFVFKMALGSKKLQKYSNFQRKMLSQREVYFSGKSPIGFRVQGKICSHLNQETEIFHKLKEYFKKTKQKNRPNIPQDINRKKNVLVPSNQRIPELKFYKYKYKVYARIIVQTKLT